MDPAPDFPVIPPLEKRAGTEPVHGRINPVINPVNTGQIRQFQTRCSGISPVCITDEHVDKDVLPVAGNPWHKVISNPFLVISPFLAALSALQAVLGHGIP
jgi:hypothetical protein